MPDSPFPPSQQPWHAVDPDTALSLFDSGEAGLSTTEAEQRLKEVGLNRLPSARRRGPLLRFLLQFHNLLIYVLLAATAVTLALSHYADAAVILGVVLINALVGFVQEGKAEAALAALGELVAPEARVLRDGHFRNLPAERLVPGDLVRIGPGDRVPADLRLVATRGLSIQEAALTGESLPVSKDRGSVEEEAPLAERNGMAYAGTLVVGGEGRGLVVATGPATEIGRIGRLIAATPSLTTPLLRKMERFARWLTVIILLLSAATVILGVWLRGYGWEEMFLAAVGLAVAAIPEGLPAIVTIALAIGVTRMARRRAIVRRLPAVETLGSVTVICSDKTGTLTRNEQVVRRVVTALDDYEVEGEGYRPEGAILRRGRPVEPLAEPILAEALEAALFCNDAELHLQGKEPTLVGSPVDGALLALAMKAGLNLQQVTAPRLDVIPFESAHKFMATLHRRDNGRAHICVKGAPERVIEMAETELGPEGARPIDRQAWLTRLNALAEEGLRVLAIAAGPSDTEALSHGSVSQGVVLLALFGMLDPARPEAAVAAQQCRSAGIDIKIITGDHAATALTVARELGLDSRGGALTGPELDRLDQAALSEAAGRVTVFARTTPEHKLRLVRALQDRGQVVAMTGDGVNDAPALKRADVGVAMGVKGTEAAKEAAEMVLTDDNFASIAAAVEEGRTVYDNIRKAIAFILPTNGGEALAILAALIFGTLLPVTAIQILWVNMITSVTLALALAVDRTEPDIMRRPPRPPREPLVSGFLVWRILFVSLLLVVAVYSLFEWALAEGRPLEAARGLAVNILVLGEAAYLLNSRHLTNACWTREGLIGNRWAVGAIATVVAAQILFLHLPAAQSLFGTAALTPLEWGACVGVAVLLFLIVEAEKWVWRHRRRQMPS